MAGNLGLVGFPIPAPATERLPRQFSQIVEFGARLQALVDVAIVSVQDFSECHPGSLGIERVSPFGSLESGESPADIHEIRIRQELISLPAVDLDDSRQFHRQKTTIIKLEMHQQDASNHCFLERHKIVSKAPVTAHIIADNR